MSAKRFLVTSVLLAGVVIQTPAIAVTSDTRFSVCAVDADARVIIIVEKASGRLYALKAHPSSDVAELKTGQPFRIKAKVGRSIGKISKQSSGNTTCGGTNVPRDANTKQPCVKKVDGKWVPC